MKAIDRITVATVVPDRLAGLEELAGNLRWAWHEPTRQLFDEISPGRGNDPLGALRAASADRLAALAADDDFVRHVAALRDDLRRYLVRARWYQSVADAPESIAYFSPEFGIAEALPQYSGGLGILAGDHLKSASDLGVPITGVGLFYRSGYFAQTIGSDGWQRERYPEREPENLPLTLLRDGDDQPAMVALAVPGGRTLNARIWMAFVGRVRLLLLDSDVPENEEELRHVTDRLYGGDSEHRLRQELLLGVGGVRALRLASTLTGDAEPRVFHMNEGHAGFLGVERIGELATRGYGFDEALALVRAGTVFTTHTPVPAGIDRFERSLVERYLSAGLIPGLDVARVLELGSETPDGSADVFNMARMGLRLAQRSNGVSQLHGQVSRRMFAPLWPGLEPEDVPIASITNGVHAPTWTDRRMIELAEKRFGSRDTTSVDWRSDALSDAALWRVRRRMRSRLVSDARRRLTAAWQSENGTSVAPAWLSRVLDPDTLTIGFARRVPTYKRLTLMLRDRDRLKRLLLDPDRPVQLVVAGKSHPADDGGKQLIQELVRFASEPEVRGHIVFLPDYDIGMAQTLYPGCDVWLNTPLRPLEACGTSGMKAALNGSLNLSILDGWWDEYYDGENGWAIPSADAAPDGAERDRIESDALYDLIENEIAPRFYHRDDQDVPREWMRQVRHTLATLSPQLSADRMVRQYVELLYLPAGRTAAELQADDGAAARAFAAWRRWVLDAWSGVRVESVNLGGSGVAVPAGTELRVEARVRLGGLDVDDVEVQLMSGAARENGELDVAHTIRMKAGGLDSSGAAIFSAPLRPTAAGELGYTVRVLPDSDLLASPTELGLVTYA